MIFLVDDDLSITELTKEALSPDFTVVSFDSAVQALQEAAEEEPELVISDVMMPEMDGFQFKEAYAGKFPHRQTPFLFLSSRSDPETVIRGLDLGADDYLTKPVNPGVLKAKVRSLLARKKRYSVPVFYGDLAKLPFVRLLQFCELKGLTGEVEVNADEAYGKLQLRGGALDDSSVEDSSLEKLYDATEGSFVIYAHPVDFREIEEAAVKKSEPPVPQIAEKDKPMGKLSGVKVNSKLFQIQTEFTTYPEAQIVTVVILDGKVVMKKKSDTPPAAAKRDLERLIEEQHTAVEDEVKEKIGDLAKKKTGTSETATEAFSRLFEDGFDLYRAGNYAEALAKWEEASKLNPADKITETNIRMLRKKLKLET